MTSIFSIHNHNTNHKQHPLRRFTYLSLILAVVAIPFISRQAFASGYTGTAQVYVDGKTLNVATSATTVADAVRDAGVTLSDKDKVEPSLDTEISDGYKINIYRSVPVTIEDKNATVELETSHKTADAIAEEAGLALNPEDTYEFEASDLSSNDLKPGITLKVDRAESIKLNLYGAVSDVRTQAKTVAEFLKEKNLSLQENDFLIIPAETPITDGLTVGIQNSFREVVVQDEEIAMPEEVIKDVNRDTSFREVQVVGAPGSKQVTYEIQKDNGVEVSRKVVSEVIITQPRKQVTLVGAKKIATSSANVSAQAKELMAAAGIAESDWDAAYRLIQKESGWNPSSVNRSSGACGLVQAYPCSKLGPNWNDPLVALRWGNGYVKRWGGWQGAWSHSQQKGWY